ncbi:hypothetical protein LSH36_583g01009 [Paralvinella palmiformis]|uniref:Nicotinate phosphoribosyltransferase n=1 Tax=Paralvinella palmiformis TaxID=53620 RepID=A0AAD9MXN7_9ANNE|nr:hypothetical protein LSH36_583g01009 [Paralvinella palmiformis]
MMMQACIREKMNIPVVFDMFYRKQPFGGGYAIFAGLSELLQILSQFSFSKDDIQYLRQLGNFEESFLNYLQEYHFSGDIWALTEGSLCFPSEPLIRIHTTLAEAQLIEGLVLNILNFQTLIATKTARMVYAAEGGKIIEFGLRRAQGFSGALWASRAAYIGGAMATSNVLAGKIYNIPVTGTMAHSWIMAFPNEQKAFQHYANVYPHSLTFLIDTYDTLQSGLPHSIQVAKKMRKQKIGIRLDSGDIEYLSREVRQQLNAAGLHSATITVSNELNEVIIHQLVQSHCPIDYWGVGTNLVTGGDSSSLGGVYKMVAKKINTIFVPTMKISDNPDKVSNPGIKQVYRFEDAQQFLADYIALHDESITPDHSYTLYHPSGDYRQFSISKYTHIIPLLSKVMQRGEICEPLPSLVNIREYVQQQLTKLDSTHKRIINPHIYKVSISEKLRYLKRSLLYHS